MPIEAPAFSHAGPWRLAIDYGALVNRTFALFVFLGFIALIEPSPYDLAFFLVVPVWFLGGFTIHRMIVPLLALLFLWTLGGYISLMPYVNEPDPTRFMAQSLYLTTSALFVALFFAED